jgi:predicted metal-dependent HD superfamily phosphohydrolase
MPSGNPYVPEPHQAPPPDRDALLARWHELLVRARGGAAEPDPHPYGLDLLGRWDERQRHYHTLRHLTAVLDRVDELAGHAADPDAVRLAAWFHDAVYRPDRSENEERSAQLAERALPEAGVPDATTAEVARLVRLTVTHAPGSADADGETLCDADLAVLAGSPEEYAHYAAAVRQEYGFVPDDAFREGRAAVLHRLLDLPELFRTPHGRAHWERTARHNLRAELELLQV